MKNDVKNVAVTFTLIALVLYGGSFLYAKKVLAETEASELAIRKEEERLRAEELINLELANFREEEERLASEKRTAELAQIEADALLAQKAREQKLATAKQAGQTAEALAREQSAYDSTKKAAADALLAQQAQADALAQQIAEQKASTQKATVAKTTTTQVTRKSRAS